MTLTQAKRHLKSYIRNGALEPSLLDASLEKVVSSWGSRAKGGKASRRKGHEYECTVAAYLRPIYPEAKRGLQGRDGAEAADVEGTPLFVECKRHRKLAGLLTLYAKACSDAAKDGRPPVVVAKEDGGPEVALVPLELLLGLLQVVSHHGYGGRELCEFGERLMEGEE